MSKTSGKEIKELALVKAERKWDTGSQKYKKINKSKVVKRRILKYHQ